MHRHAWGPMFQVLGREAARQGGCRARTSLRFESPEFRLVPTPAYFCVTGLGVLLTFLPLLAGSVAVAGAIAAILIVLCNVQLARIWRVSQQRVRLGNRQDLLPAWPPTRAKFNATMWCIYLVPATLTMVALYLRRVSEAEPNWIAGKPLVNGWLVFAACLAMFGLWAALMAILGRTAPMFRIPELEGRYMSVTMTVQEKITQTTKPRRYRDPAQNWRATRNMAQATHLFGQMVVFFDVEHKTELWKKSLRSLLWYYTPATLPLVIQVLLPIMVLNAGAGPDASPMFQVDKTTLGLCAVLWACWTMCILVLLAKHDFGDSLYDSQAAAMTDVDVIQLGDAARLQELRSHLSGQGLAIKEVWVLVVTPMLMGYLGLFP
jgi:hypothetical protein